MFKGLLIASIATTLTACGSSSNTDTAQTTDSRRVSTIGVVIAEDEIEAGFDSATSSLQAFFGRYENPETEATAINVIRRAVDTCVTSEESAGSNSADNFLEILSFAPVSAGSTLTFNSTGGSRFQATPITGGLPAIFYRAEPEPSFPLPQGLSVDIPGQDFPAITGSFPDIAALTGFLPASNRRTTVVTPDTQFTWQAGTDSNARIIIRSDSSGSASRQPPEGFACAFIDEDGFCQLSPLDFYCDVQDDGFFEFPESIKAALGAEYVNEGELVAIRRSIRSVLQGSSALLLVRERQAD